MLEIINLTKKYKKNDVLQSIQLKIDKGGLYIFQGINGSGKSTLLKIIAKIIYKSSGTYESKCTIAYLPDKFGLPKLSRVDRYLKDIFKLLRKDPQKVDLLLEEYQIPKKRIGELSKGNLQKLGILQTFSNDADCYIIDEPLDGLDEYAKKLFKEKITEKIKEDKIIILSLHHKNLYSDLNPTIYELKKGECHEKRKKA